MENKKTTKIGKERKRILRKLKKLKKPNYRVGKINESIYWENDVVNIIKDINI